MASNHLLLGKKAEENAADDLLASISRIAIPSKPDEVEDLVPEKVPKVKKKPKRRRRSRFFYTPSKSFVAEVNERRSLSKPTVLSIVDEEIEGRKTEYSKELPPMLRTHIKEVREFFLNELGPFTLGAQTGSLQALDVVQRTLGTDVGPQLFSQFERMLQDAAAMKMARFITRYLGLPTTTSRQLLEAVQPKKEAFLFNMGGSEDRRQRTRGVEKPKEVPATAVTEDEKD